MKGTLLCTAIPDTSVFHTKREGPFEPVGTEDCPLAREKRGSGTSLMRECASSTQFSNPSATLVSYAHCAYHVIFLSAESTSRLWGIHSKLQVASAANKMALFG